MVEEVDLPKIRKRNMRGERRMMSRRRTRTRRSERHQNIDDKGEEKNDFKDDGRYVNLHGNGNDVLSLSLTVEGAGWL